ncbi:hypothetical protein M3Y99_01494500 [Aphelenchoides fujianensis]|nr:hypothetical protein M3Y99_01494500 [Aphelenchoides fujianensis]
MKTLRFQVFTLLVLVVLAAAAQPPAERRLQKRLNFNFLRTWQPIHDGAEPLRESYISEEAPKSGGLLGQPIDLPARSVESRVRSRWLCIRAMVNPAACAHI